MISSNVQVVAHPPERRRRAATTLYAGCCCCCCCLHTAGSLLAVAIVPLTFRDRLTMPAAGTPDQAAKARKIAYSTCATYWSAVCVQLLPIAMCVILSWPTEEASLEGGILAVLIF